MSRSRVPRYLALSLILSLPLHAAGGSNTPAPGRPGAAPKTMVFILAGQSNMEGKGDGAKLAEDERAALRRVQRQVRLASNREPIRPLDVSVASAGNRKKFGIASSFGPELFFGLRLAGAWPDQPILLIKRAVGATSLYGCWNPDWSLEKATLMGEATAPRLYLDLISYVREVTAGLNQERFEFGGVLWVQGEADSNVGKVGPLPAASYGENLANLIHRVRQDTGVPDLPFLLVQVGGGKVVEGMQSVAARVPHVTLIPQSSDPVSPNYFPKHAVGHYSYEGQKRIGTLLAEAFLEHYASPPGPRAPVR